MHSRIIINPEFHVNHLLKIFGFRKYAEEFDLAEAKLYNTDPEILTMTNLVNFYQNNDTIKLGKSLKTNIIVTLWMIP